MAPWRIGTTKFVGNTTLAFFNWIDLDKIFSSVLVWLAGAVVGVFNEMFGSPAPRLLFVFLWFTLFDWIAGAMAAKLEGQHWSSEKARKGAYKLLGAILIASASHMIDRYSIDMLGQATNGFVMRVVLSGFIGTEFLSILKNAERCGCIIPKWLVNIGKKVVQNCQQDPTKPEKEGSDKDE